MPLPRARREGLTVRELSDETLIYDMKHHKAHCLNPTAALVWRYCNGQTTAAELAAILNRRLQVPADERVVELAVDELGRADLLQQFTPGPRGERLSRRAVLKQLGVALALVPAVLSVTAPTAAAAASPIINGQACRTTADCPAGLVCLNGICQPPVRQDP